MTRKYCKMKNCFVISFALLLSFALSLNALADLNVPDKWEECVVAIGQEVYEVKNKFTGEVEKKNSLFGAGVVLQTDRYILVTAKHVVFDEHGKLRPNLCFWGNRKDGTEFKRYFSNLSNKYPSLKWVPHNDSGVDIVATVIGLIPKKESVSLLTLDDFEEVARIRKGDDVYYLGFPLGFGASYGVDPMVRKGIVALKEKKDKFFYIDATVAPGNSGGPVFRVRNNKPKLIGIVSQFRPFYRAGDYFHTGLGVVYPINYIKELLESDEFRSTY